MSKLNTNRLQPTPTRPVPLEMEFLGVSVANMQARNNLMNEIAYNKVAGGRLGGSWG